VNLIIQQLLKAFATDSAKAKARNGNRTAQSIGVAALLLIAYRQDGRMARIEQRITNAPISIPFTLSPSNAPSLNLVKDFNR
jgi:hypothetical protein